MKKKLKPSTVVKDGKTRKSTWIPTALVEIAEKLVGTPANPLNWSAYILSLVVKDLINRGAQIK